jgi:biopolymer transport protein ExbB
MSLSFSSALMAEEVSASVNWMQEVVNGGVTSIALGILCLGSVAVLVERFRQLKLNRFTPPKTVELVQKYWASSNFSALHQQLLKENSVLARVMSFAIQHRQANVDMIYSGASDMIHRAMRKENQTNTFLAVSAALAPLLGLLGTMIGMIESFKLVELYGDEGGASMLAGSISKALITTAVGLIIAILSLLAYHFFKIRTSSISLDLEETVEQILNRTFLPSSSFGKPHKKASCEGERHSQAMKSSRKSDKVKKSSPVSPS